MRRTYELEACIANNLSGLTSRFPLYPDSVPSLKLSFITHQYQSRAERADEIRTK